MIHYFNIENKDLKLINVIVWSVRLYFWVCKSFSNTFLLFKLFLNIFTPDIEFRFLWSATYFS